MKMDGERFNSKLIEIETINENTKILKFSVPPSFEFKAGQYVTLALYRGDKRILHSYSIFSSPNEKGYILIYFKKVEDGFASNKLFNMEIGEEIEMKGPMGFFTTKDINKDLIFISSGTGFAPVRSMVLNALQNNSKNKIILIRGYRIESSLCYEDELKTLKSKYKNFEYFNILSKPLDKDYSLTGHVQDFLEKLIPRGFMGDFYMCGLKEMVNGVKEKLNEMGFSKEQIFFERYD